MLQHIVLFLSVDDVICFQQTCSSFRTRYLKLLWQGEEGQNRILSRHIRANLSSLWGLNLRHVSSIESYAHIKTIELPSFEEHLQNIIKELAQKSTNQELIIITYNTEKLLDALGKTKAYGLNISGSPTTLDVLKSSLLFQGLKKLVMTGHEITQVNALAEIPLIELNLVSTNVTEVSVLNHIHTLNLSSCPVLDVSAFGHPNSRVQYLNLSHTKVKDVSMLGNVPTLNLSHTLVEDVNGLGNVYDLNISETKVSDISALHSVHILDASGTKVSDISGLHSVQILDISGTCVIDLGSLSMLRYLHTLTYRRAGVKVKNLYGLSHISAIDLAGWRWQAGDLDLNALKNTHTLDLRNALFDAPDLSMLGQVRVLDLSGTNVKDVSALGNVYDLNISETQVSDVSKLANVRKLNIAKTQVTKIENLEYLESLVSHFEVKRYKKLKNIRHIEIVELQDIERLLDNLEDVEDKKINKNIQKQLRKLGLRRVRNREKWIKN